MSGRDWMHSLGVGLFALLLAGCSGGSGRLQGGDPLVGGGPPLPKDGTARGKDQGLPPVPVPSASTSPAALASGDGVAALDGDRKLRIGDNPEANSWRGPSSGVSLSKPQPLTGGAGPSPAPSQPQPQFQPQPLPPVPVVGGASQDMLRTLEQRGVQGFRLERNRETGQWRCTCSIPGQQNPSVKQTYDATAADAQSALRSVVEQVERDRP